MGVYSSITDMLSDQDSIQIIAREIFLLLDLVNFIRSGTIHGMGAILNLIIKVLVLLAPHS